MDNLQKMNFHFVKTISFGQFQIVQIKTDTLTRIEYAYVRSRGCVANVALTSFVDHEVSSKPHLVWRKPKRKNY